MYVFILIFFSVFFRFNDAIFKLNAALKHEKENIRFIVNAKEKMCHSHYKVSKLLKINLYFTVPVTYYLMETIKNFVYSYLGPIMTISKTFKLQVRRKIEVAMVFYI